MTRPTYLDSSALLAHVYGEARALDPAGFGPTGTSALARVECLRSLDRRRVQGRIPEPALAAAREYLASAFKAMHVAAVTARTLDRAAYPLPVPLGTLDAIHLVTALQWREDLEEEIVFATHDRGLAAAARANGFEVVGA